MSVFQNDYTDNVKIYYNELKKCVPLDANAERELLIKSNVSVTEIFEACFVFHRNFNSSARD